MIHGQTTLTSAHRCQVSRTGVTHGLPLPANLFAWTAGACRSQTRRRAKGRSCPRVIDGAAFLAGANQAVLPGGRVYITMQFLHATYANGRCRHRSEKKFTGRRRGVKCGVRIQQSRLARGQAMQIGSDHSVEADSALTNDQRRRQISGSAGDAMPTDRRQGCRRRHGGQGT